jgi:hypothetical protein
MNEINIISDELEVVGYQLKVSVKHSEITSLTSLYSSKFAELMDLWCRLDQIIIYESL